MSIQQAINQGVSVASLLYTQTASYASKKVEKEIKTKNTELERQLKNDKNLRNAWMDTSNKIMREKAAEGELTADEMEKEWKENKPFIKEVSEDLRQIARLTGKPEDTQAYVEQRRRDIWYNEGMKSDIAEIRRIEAEESLAQAQEQKRMKRKGPKSFDEKVQALRDSGLPNDYVDKLNKQGVDTAYQSIKKGGKK